MSIVDERTVVPIDPADLDRARRILEAMTDVQYRRWTDRIIAVIAGYYVAYGGWLLVMTP